MEGKTVRVTIRDVAKASGVSYATVSKALNNTDSVSPATQERVREAARRLGYRPNLHAQSLRSTQTTSVVVVVRGPLNPFFTSLLDPLEEKLRAAGLQASLLRVSEQGNEIASAHEYVQSFRTKGIIFLGGSSRRFAADNRPPFGLPSVATTVAFENAADAQGINAVGIDEDAEMDKIVEHLHQLGHHRLALLGWREDDDSVSSVRKRAFCRAVEKYQMALEPGLIISNSYGAKPFSYRYGYLQCQELLAEGHDFSAIVALSDTVALGAQRALEENGLQLGKDVDLTGFDGIEASLYPTKLTTIVQPVELLAQKSVELLLAQFEPAQTGPPQELVYLPATLRVGTSTHALSELNGQS